MADFVAVLRKTLDGLGDPDPAMRSRVYDKARATVASKLAALNPPPQPGVADRQKRSLEDAIASIEREYAAASAAKADPLTELENVFASLKDPQPKPIGPTAPAARAEPAAAFPPPSPVHGDDEAAGNAGLPEELGGGDEGAFFPPPRYEADVKRGYGRFLAAAVVLAMLAGGAFGIWLNKDAFGALLGLSGEEVAVALSAAEPQPEPTAAVEPEAVPATTEPAPAPPAMEAAAEPPAAEPLAEAATAASLPIESGKFTQRLTPEGTEIDPGPAGGESGIGEGTSVAALTQQPPASPDGSDDAEPAAAGGELAATGEPQPPGPAAAAEVPATTEVSAAGPAEAAVAVAQKAIFYEERTSAAEGSAQPGSIVWSLVQESPGGSLPPEPAIRAEATIPGKDVQLRMTIKRNADQSLPASHIIEMIFLTPEGFEGGGIQSILRVAMKSSEEEAGSPLIGIPAKIADGFFLVALNDTKAEIEANLTLLRRQSWIDVPVVYKSGRRALLTMEKGIPGDKVFDEALKAWQAASAG